MKKLPTDIKLLVDKGNFVMAIKELSANENISMTEAKEIIDAYEEKKKADLIVKNNNPKKAFNKIHLFAIAVINIFILIIIAIFIYNQFIMK